jgi:hypothetical protein
MKEIMMMMGWNMYILNWNDVKMKYLKICKDYWSNYYDWGELIFILRITFLSIFKKYQNSMSFILNNKKHQDLHHAWMIIPDIITGTHCFGGNLVFLQK